MLPFGELPRCEKTQDSFQSVFTPDACSEETVNASKRKKGFGPAVSGSANFIDRYAWEM